MNSITESQTDEVIVSHQMYSNDYINLSYSRGIHQCFRYYNHGYVSDPGHKGYRSRISEFDIFGTLYLMKCPTLLQIKRFTMYFSSFLSIFLCLS